MTEETQASLLAHWLQSPPGTLAPEGLDPDVLAAVYSLSPDRAPPIRLTVDDILGSVREGPLAAPTAPSVGSSEPVGPARKDAERTSSGTAGRGHHSPPERRPPLSRVWWAVPGVGIVVTAAAAALIVVKVGVLNAPDSVEIARFSAPTAAPDEAAPAAAESDPSPSGAPVSATAAAPAPSAALPPPRPPRLRPTTLPAGSPKPLPRRRLRPARSERMPEASARSGSRRPIWQRKRRMRVPLGTSRTSSRRRPNRRSPTATLTPSPGTTATPRSSPPPARARRRPKTQRSPNRCSRPRPPEKPPRA